MSVKVPLSVGDKQTFTKTIAGSDVYQFAGITGDFLQNFLTQDTNNLKREVNI